MSDVRCIRKYTPTVYNTSPQSETTALINLLSDCRLELWHMKDLTILVSSASSLLFLRLHWLVHFSLPRICPDRMLKSSVIDIFILSQIVCSNNIKGGPLPFRLPKWQVPFGHFYTACIFGVNQFPLSFQEFPRNKTCLQIVWPNIQNSLQWFQIPIFM